MASNGIPQPASPDDQVGKLHILVVNETQEILDLIREILEEEGYRVSPSTFAINDLDAILTVALDLVILDYMKGGEEAGWQVLQKLKMVRRTAGIPVIDCTAALGLVRDLEGHLRARNVGIVLKPFDFDDLINEIRKRVRPGHDPVQVDAQPSA